MSAHLLSNLRNRYTVTPTGNPRMPYQLEGKRGASYGLMATVGHEGDPRYMLFAISGKTGRVARLSGGSEWVTDDLSQ